MEQPVDRGATPPPAEPDPRAAERWGLLLVNLGSPDAPEPGPVRRYLREFLSDPRVIDIPAPSRKLLLELVILPTRPRASAEAYTKVWTERGSPLIFHGRDLASGVAAALPGVPVELGMRYGEPSLASALARLDLAGAERVVVLPLFPQYSSAAWGSAVEAVWRELGRRWNVPAVQVVPTFFDHPAFIRAQAEVARPVLADARAERVLMSFHGLPERQVKKSDRSGAHCLASPGCCEALGPVNRSCYRAQCYATARALTAALELPPEQVVVGFQSRLGRTPWIQPHTDVLVRELAEAGVKRLAVLEPSFVADCLETLEEIGLRARDDFLARGGEELVLVPCVNAHPAWVAGVVELVRETTGLSA